MKGFNLPFVTNVPIEKEKEFEEEEAKIELAYEVQKNLKLNKLFNNKTSKLRRVGDYLWNHINEKLSYKQIAQDLGMSEGAIRLRVGELNFYRKFPITMMPIPKEPGFIQSILDNDEDYEKWDSKKMRTITSMNAVRTKANKTTKAKRKVRVKQKTKEKVIVVETQ